MIAIIGAMDLELELLFRDFVLEQSVTIADKKIYVGSLYGKKVVIAKSGIGKVNAAMTATILCANYPIESIINIGVAGGIAPSQSGDIILANAIAYFDVSLVDIDPIPYGKMGDDPLLVPADPVLFQQAEAILRRMTLPYQKGIIVSGDQFVTHQDVLKPIQNTLSNIIACEMEGMAIAMVSTKFKIPFLSIRGVSDVIGDLDQDKKYHTSVQQIAKATTAFVMEFLKN